MDVITLRMVHGGKGSWLLIHKQDNSGRGINPSAVITGG